MPNQQDRANTFHTLHVKGDPIILYNVWDAGSAKAVARGGAKALATGSHSVAQALGFDDGEALPLGLAIENIARIVDATDLPVTMDFEGGYARDTNKVYENTKLALSAGVIGFNFEDQIIGTANLYEINEQADRIAAVRRACVDIKVDAFINARTDIFLKVKGDTHDAAMVDQALERAAAYAKAGASGIFVPGLINADLLSKMCAASLLPVNVMTFAGAPTNQELAQLGVARISYGPGPWRQAMAFVEESARKIYG